MNAKYLLPIANGIIVLGLLVGLGAMAYQDVETPRLADIEAIEAAAAGITGMVNSAERNLESASNLWNHVERMKTEPAFETDPFTPPRPPEPEPADDEPVETDEPSEVDDIEPEPAEEDEQFVSPIPDEERDIYRVRDQTEWPDLKLTGTVVSGDRSLAIINGEVYRLGSIVEGLQLREIGRDYVLLVSPIPGEERRVLLE